MQFDQKTMATRFHYLREQRDAVRAQSAPLRAKRDAIETKARAECEKIDAKIREIEAVLPQFKNEMAVISRALNGKTSLNTDGNT